MNDPNRRPRRGRPPKFDRDYGGGKGALVAARVSPEMRRAIEIESERTGRSISEVVCFWLDEAAVWAAFKRRLVTEDASAKLSFRTIEVADGAMTGRASLSAETVTFRPNWSARATDYVVQWTDPTSKGDDR